MQKPRKKVEVLILIYKDELALLKELFKYES